MARRSKNLLKNHCGKAGLEHWEVCCSGGDGFKVEDTPDGCKPICECTTVKKNKCCWSTSHDACEKLQLVDLLAAGISDERLDNKKPNIIARDWYGARFDCGCSYRITVRLLDSGREELDKWEFTDDLDEGTDWKKARHVFKNYPEGVRYVEFKHGGEDNKNWAGHFGVKMTNSGVFVGKKRRTIKKRAVESAAGKNLIKNACAKDGLEQWEVMTSGGDGFLVQEDGGGCMPLPEVNSDAADSQCWATSHGECAKKQTINLGFEGFDDEFMDEVQPEIKFSEWFGCRHDAGVSYWLTVNLLNGDMESVDTREIRETKDACGDWFQVGGSFSGYGAGVRFVEYMHGGQDTCSWAGHYGAKFTCASVVVCVEKKEDTSSSSSSSDED